MKFLSIVTFPLQSDLYRRDRQKMYDLALYHNPRARKKRSTRHVTASIPRNPIRRASETNPDFEFHGDQTGKSPILPTLHWPTQSPGEENSNTQSMMRERQNSVTGAPPSASEQCRPKRASTTERLHKIENHRPQFIQAATASDSFGSSSSFGSAGPSSKGASPTEGSVSVTERTMDKLRDRLLTVNIGDECQPPIPPIVAEISVSEARSRASKKRSKTVPAKSGSKTETVTLKPSGKESATDNASAPSTQAPSPTEGNDSVSFSESVSISTDSRSRSVTDGSVSVSASVSVSTSAINSASDEFEGKTKASIRAAIEKAREAGKKKKPERITHIERAKRLDKVAETYVANVVPKKKLRIHEISTKNFDLVTSFVDFLIQQKLTCNKAFRIMDGNRSGEVSRFEFKATLGRMGFKHEQFTSEDLFHLLDQDHDGAVQRCEFDNLEPYLERRLESRGGKRVAA